MKRGDWYLFDNPWSFNKRFANGLMPVLDKKPARLLDIETDISQLLYPSAWFIGETNAPSVKEVCLEKKEPGKTEKRSGYKPSKW